MKNLSITNKIKNSSSFFGILKTLLLIVAFFIFNSCTKEEKSTKVESHEEHGHEENVANIVTLNPEQMKSVGLQLGVIEQKQITTTLKANGFLKVPNNNKGSVTSVYGGVIKTLNVQIGDVVKKNQIIATIYNPQFILKQEEYLGVSAKITYAEQELERQLVLKNGNAGALKNYQSASADLKILQAQKASLTQQLKLMGINSNTLSPQNLISELSILSPIDGTISNILAKIGSNVDISSPIAEIVDNNQIHLDLNVFEKDISLLKVGQIIHFTLTNNAVNEYDAKIYSIGTSFENESKTISVHAAVQGNKTGLIDGMNISAIVSLNDVTSAAVPNDAILNADGKNFIFIVTDKKVEEHKEEGEKHDHKEGEEHDHKEGEKHDHKEGEKHDHKEGEKHDHKEGEKHDHKEGEDHDHKEGEEHKEGEDHDHKEGSMNFEKIEVIKGVSNMGFTAITFIQDVPKNAKIVVKGAFFVNAKLTNKGEGHSH